MAAGFVKLAQFPRNRLVGEVLGGCRVSELDLLARFGAPTLETPANEPDPTFYWDLEFSCGLVMALQFDQLRQVLLIRLDHPEVAHALRHLGSSVSEVWSLETADPSAFAALGETPEAQAATWEVCTEDPAGHRSRVVVGLVARDAQCQCAELQEHGENPKYWVLDAAR